MQTKAQDGTACAVAAHTGAMGVISLGYAVALAHTVSIAVTLSLSYQEPISRER